LVAVAAAPGETILAEIAARAIQPAFSTKAILSPSR
jgi:hypothetical protein